MNRIAQARIRLLGSRSKALIPYMTPEFPFKGTTLPLLHGLAREADMIEVGIPFSDPLADGSTIQHASQIALRNGVNLPLIFRAVHDFRLQSDVPVILMGYVNAILRFGIKRFASEAREAGVDGLIVPDLPPEEAQELMDACSVVGLSNIFLIAPTTPDDRIRMIDGMSTDFSYCVSVTGVTGERATLGDNGTVDVFLKRVKANVTKPFVVGFGVSSREHVNQIWKYADGAVVGSALLRSLGSAQTIDEAVHAATTFMHKLRPES